MSPGNELETNKNNTFYSTKMFFRDYLIIKFTAGGHDMSFPLNE